MGSHSGTHPRIITPFLEARDTGETLGQKQHILNKSRKRVSDVKNQNIVLKEDAGFDCLKIKARHYGHGSMYWQRFRCAQLLSPGLGLEQDPRFKRYNSPVKIKAIKNKREADMVVCVCNLAFRKLRHSVNSGPA